MSDPESAHHLLSRALRKHIESVRETSGRILARRGGKRALEDERPEKGTGADDEAIHDFRVALRRLRTALRPGRKLYGRKKMRALSQALKRFADATSALRDEEVLRETLTSLDVPEEARSVLLAWTGRRSRQERARRADIVRLLRGEKSTTPGGEALPTLEDCLDSLEKRIEQPKREVPAAELGERAMAKARADIRAIGHVRPDDATAMHALRIRFKRLRYTAELFEPALESEAAKDTIETATRLQTCLGDLHDMDQAVFRMSRAWGLPTVARSVVLSALRAARARQAERCMEELASAGVDVADTSHSR